MVSRDCSNAAYLRDPETGFTLIELMLAILLTAIIFAASATFLVDATKIASRERSRAETHQAGRVVLQFLSSDLRMAGCGFDFGGGTPVDSILLTDSPPIKSTPDNTATDSNSITLRSIRGNRLTDLAQNATVNDFYFRVDDASRFAVDDRIIVYDTTGDYELLNIYSVDTTLNPDRIEVRDTGASPPVLTKAWPSGSIVGVLREVVYSPTASGDGVARSIDGATSIPIDEQIDNLMFTYFDGPGTSDIFVPATVTQRRLIQRVGINLSAISRTTSGPNMATYHRWSSNTEVVLRNRSF